MIHEMSLVLNGIDRFNIVCESNVKMALTGFDLSQQMYLFISCGTCNF